MKAGAAALAVMLCAPVPAAAAGVLDELGWSKRVLVALAPEAGDPRVQRLRSLMQERRCEVDDRDLLLLVAPARGTGSLDHEALTPAQVESVRLRVGLGSGDFAVVLVGRDGGEKLRTTEVPALGEVFALIDGMPMRRAEMREHPTPCPGPREKG